MPTFRFSLLTLFGVTAYVGVGGAILAYPTHFWASTLQGVVVVALLLALVKAVQCCQQARSFWTGFLAFGATYFILTAIPAAKPSVPLPTTPVLVYLRYVTGKTDRLPPGCWPADYQDPFGAISFGDPQSALFDETGHLLFTLPFACLGGIIARVLASRSLRSAGSAANQVRLATNRQLAE